MNTTFGQHITTNLAPTKIPIVYLIMVKCTVTLRLMKTTSIFAKNSSLVLAYSQCKRMCIYIGSSQLHAMLAISFMTKLEGLFSAALLKVKATYYNSCFIQNVKINKENIFLKSLQRDLTVQKLNTQRGKVYTCICSQTNTKVKVLSERVVWQEGEITLTKYN